MTLRQKEVLQLLAEGHSMKGAAFILNVSPRTVAYHKYTMMDHLSIRSSAELIEYAMNAFDSDRVKFDKRFCLTATRLHSRLNAREKFLNYFLLLLRVFFLQQHSSIAGCSLRLKRS